MATVDMTSGSAYHVAAQPHTVGMYKKVVEVDFAEATTTKGSALAATDVVEVADIPAGTMIFGGTMEVLTAMTGTATDLTLDMGVTGGDVDAFVDGFDFDAAAVGDLATPAAAAGSLPVWVASDDTVDILIATQTGTFTGGKVRVTLFCADAKGVGNGGVAAAGS